MGKAQSTVQAALKKEKIPEGWYAILNRKFGLSIEWIMNGTGTRLIGSQEFSPQHPSPAINASEASGNLPQMPLNYRMQDIFLMVTSVMESGTTYAQALLYNIQHFDRAVKSEQKIQSLEQKISELYNAIAFLQNEMATLKREYCQRLIDKEGVEDPDLPEICRPLAKAG